MNAIDTSLPELSKLIEQRLALVRSLAESLESSSLALARTDAEALARGAAHQAELCRQWSHLEPELRSQAGSRSPAEAGGSARLQAQWEALGVRIRHVTRVHWSLLRHLERSLAIMHRLVDSCAPTYRPNLGLLQTTVKSEFHPRTGE